MHMAERIVPTDIETIVIKNAVPVKDGTLINGSLNTPIPFQRIQEYQEVAEMSRGCYCHIVGEHRFCAVSEGAEIPDLAIETNKPIPIFNDENPLSLGKLVENPEIATFLYEEAELERLERWEKAKVHPSQINEELEASIIKVGEINESLSNPASSRNTKKDIINYVKQIEIPATSITAAIIYAANKLNS